MAKFHKVWLWFLGLLALIIAGFWSSYFGRLFVGAHTTHHFHAIVMLAWVFLLIGQALLVRQKKRRFHRQLGKFSYLLAPLVVISTVAVAFHTIGVRGASGIGGFWFSLYSAVLFGLLYALAIFYRRNFELHARYMIATGLVFVVPAWGRLYFSQLVPLGFPPPSDPLIVQMTPLIIGIALIAWDWRYDRIRAPFVVFTSLWIFHLLIWHQLVPNWEWWAHFSSWAADLEMFE